MEKMLVTVGRSVYYYPSQADRDGGITQNQKEPLAGVVATVHDENTITLAAFDSHGLPFSAREIEFKSDEVSDEEKETGGFACWMPYQIGQAKKTEELKEKLDTVGNVYTPPASD